MNKLGILAFALLLFFSTMLWYLANGSLNEYLKSQIELQGHYYSGQKTTLALADFSSNTNIATLKQLRVANLPSFQTENVLIIDEAYVELSTRKSEHLLTEIQQLTINKLTINTEKDANSITNTEQLINKISLKLAHDYPQDYPQISAKIYAENNPELNADLNTKLNVKVSSTLHTTKNSQSTKTIEPIKKKKSRGKPQQKILISTINIKNLELNIIEKGVTSSTQHHNINTTTIGGAQGMISNQIGGEILLSLFKLAK